MANGAILGQTAPTPTAQEVTVQQSTAQQFGLTGDATVDQVLSLLSRFQTGLGNEYLWEKSKTGWSGSASGNLTLDDGDPGTYNCSNSYSISENGEISLSGNIEEHLWKDIPNGWYTDYYNLDNELYQLNSQTGSTIRTYKTITPVLGKIDISYVNSTNPSAYPPSVSDGYTYTPIGQLGNKVQIATGSYVGTGTYGASNPCTLTFDFAPEFLWIYMSEVNDASDNAFGSHNLYVCVMNPYMITPSNANRDMLNFFGTNSNFRIQRIVWSNEGKTVTWWSSDGNQDQMNYNIYKYFYFIIG